MFSCWESRFSLIAEWEQEAEHFLEVVEEKFEISDWRKELFWKVKFKTCTLNNLKKESKPQSHVRWGMTSEQGDQVRARDPGGSWEERCWLMISFLGASKGPNSWRPVSGRRCGPAQGQVWWRGSEFWGLEFSSVQLLSRVWLFVHPMDCSKPGFPVHHQLSEFTQTHVHRVGDAIQLSHLLSSPSPPAFSLAQHRSFSKESVLFIRWSKDWSFSFSISPSNE